MATIRIDKYVSVACGITRTEAKALLKSGKILCDGKAVVKPETKIDDTATVMYGENRLVYKEFIYILMNKPSGILTACNDKRAKTVIDLVPDALHRNGLFPVGRLDKNTTGLLIITDDGDFGHKVISPKSNIKKRYDVELDGEVKKEYEAVFKNGIVLADGEKCLPAELIITGFSSASVIINEGKYHQIKRMFGTVGLGVNKLHRASIGRLTLPPDMPEGFCRELTDEEVASVFE